MQEIDKRSGEQVDICVGNMGTIKRFQVNIIINFGGHHFLWGIEGDMSI